MPLKNLLERLEEQGINKVFVNYRSNDGEMRNICYQDRVFFHVVDKRKIRFLNPLRVAETLKKIENKELELMGSGNYLQPINFNKDYKNNVKGNQSWKLY